MIGFRGPARVCFALAVFIYTFIVVGCASYQSKVDKARKMLSSGQPLEATEHFKPLAAQDGKDQLVYLLDYATVLQLSGLYKESINTFIQADKMSEVKDYTSLSKEGASLLLNEGMVQYKGDDYEKVLINAMNAINFLMVDDLDGALIETRRVIEKLRLYRYEAKKEYEQNTWATYLGAMIWEADRKWDDAYISYEQAYKLNPHIPYIKEDLVRAAMMARREEVQKKWQKEFGITPQKQWRNHKLGEVVLVYQQGWGPRKQPHPNWQSIPKLYPVSAFTTQAKMVVMDASGQVLNEELSQQIYSVTDAAIKTLDEQYTALIAKRVAGKAVKAVAADQVRQKNELLGNIAWIAMNVADQADLRQWSTLPGEFQIAKLRLPPGKYKLRIQGLTSQGIPSGESTPEDMQIEIRPGKKTFVSWRSYL